MREPDLVARLRGPVKHPQQNVTLRLEAADMIEAQAAELALLHEIAEVLDGMDYVPDVVNDAVRKWEKET